MKARFDWILARTDQSERSAAPPSSQTSFALPRALSSLLILATLPLA